jgi:peptidoglycan glycosyltransferase
VNAPLRRLAAVVALMLTSLLISSTWVQFVDAGSLKDQPTNTRSLYRELGRERGPLLVGGTPIARSVPVDDDYKFQRQYPQGPLYAPVTGAFSLEYGATGLEQTEGGYLSGTADQLFYRRISDLLTGAEQKGASVRTTINAKAQQAAWDGLGNQRGAVVALDPDTGDILAMVSKPSYDPNLLAGHDRATARKNRARLLADDDDPLINRAINALYFPGSTFKVITSAAALSTGDFTPDTQLSGPARLKLPDTASASLGNDDGAPCSGSFTHILEISCNTAYAQIGLDLGAAALNAQAEKFGFGQELSVPLRVSPSQFPADANRPQTAQSAIGQFDVKATPLQIAMMSAAVANDGTVMRPNLVKDVQTAQLQTIDTHQPQELGEAVDADVADQLTTMMKAVVQSGTGTRAQISGIEVAGKTGTAQSVKGVAPDTWFTAFAPADDPKVAVAVVVEKGGRLGNEAFGGTVAAPIARDVMEAVIGR